ncbi:MAG: hypothetical protein RE468_10055 [Acidithiobacillus caldus]|uniref:hypothetical protein n=1 Tax=Acidithiobacillus caldus TaxID=33059 RepID=UPI001D00FCCC|nr:hypothetical protein [Acidithiobacillus caldus]WMT46237.1 MAG: hypothetical protein RE468_10055 [Acidithiobacillus caldus]
MSTVQSVIRKILRIFVEDVPVSGMVSAYNLRIGVTPECPVAVNDPGGDGGFQLAIDKFLREENPDLIFLRSDTEDLSVVRKALAYLSRRGQEVVVAEQLPDEEVAAAMGVSVREYQSAVINPNGDAAALAG